MTAYFGIGLWDRKTLEQIGEDLGLTKERIRQKVNLGLDKLRSNTSLLEATSKKRRNIESIKLDLIFGVDVSE